MASFGPRGAIASVGYTKGVVGVGGVGAMAAVGAMASVGAIAAIAGRYSGKKERYKGPKGRGPRGSRRDSSLSLRPARLFSPSKEESIIEE